MTKSIYKPTDTELNEMGFLNGSCGFITYDYVTLEWFYDVGNEYPYVVYPESRQDVETLIRLLSKD